MIQCGHRTSLFPYTTLFRSQEECRRLALTVGIGDFDLSKRGKRRSLVATPAEPDDTVVGDASGLIGSSERFGFEDRKSTRLNSSHQIISYAVFCLKKKI